MAEIRKENDLEIDIIDLSSNKKRTTNEKRIINEKRTSSEKSVNPEKRKNATNKTNVTNKTNSAKKINDKKKISKGERKKNIVTTSIFLLIVFGFTIASIFRKDVGFSDTENRVLTQKPEFTFEALFEGTFTSNYQDYVRDQFPLRNEFVAARNYCEKYTLKTKINGVLICDDDYYIESHERENYEGEQAEINSEAIKSFVDRYVNKLGVHKVSVIVAPTAQSILKDKLKDNMYVYDQKDYLDGIKELVGSEVYVDAYDVLKGCAKDYIYYKTDHHWTTYGAYQVYKNWADKKGFDVIEEQDITVKNVTNEFLGTINNKLNMNMKMDTIQSYMVNDIDYTVTINRAERKDFFYDEYLEKKDKYAYFLGGNPGLVSVVAKKNADDELINDKKLLIIKDSYANCISSVYSANFGETYIVDLRYFNMSIDKFTETYGITDVIVMYNADSFATDKYIKKLK